ncbi:hypothetical protein [uncultured Streptomyces sp.]|uniref:hypothetical protein n=1 Tax=uncultured Streptomyces sp. TaxID=174707 RepID=UPI00260F8C37|nr:hypothetical protein [uncultured Streptomyces sp.]
MTIDESAAEDPELNFWTMLLDTNTRLVREDGFVWRPNAISSRSDLDLPPVVPDDHRLGYVARNSAAHSVQRVNTIPDKPCPRSTTPRGSKPTMSSTRRSWLARNRGRHPVGGLTECQSTGLRGEKGHSGGA